MPPAAADDAVAPRGPKSRPPWITWLFADRKTGRIVIGQFPNLVLWIFLGAVIVRLVLGPTGVWGTAVNAVADIALLWWAIDEIVRGVNPFRRILGATVTVFVLFGIAFGILA